MTEAREASGQWMHIYSVFAKCPNLFLAQTEDISFNRVLKWLPGFSASAYTINLGNFQKQTKVARGKNSRKKLLATSWNTNLEAKTKRLGCEKRPLTSQCPCWFHHKRHSYGEVCFSCGFIGFRVLEWAFN